MTKTQIEEALKGSLDFWNEISGSERQEIINNSVPVKHSAGETVHDALDDCVGMLLVVSGELRTYLLSDSGKEFTLFRLGEGDVCILSASCLLKDITFDVFIDAEADCELLVISSLVLSRLQDQNPLIENFALRMAAGKFSAVIGAMERMMFMSFEERLAVFLKGEYEKTASTEICLTHEQIAKYIGSAREVVSRAMKKLEKEGILRLHRGGLEITNMEKLKQIADKE